MEREESHVVSVGLAKVLRHDRAPLGPHSKITGASVLTKASLWPVVSVYVLALVYYSEV